MSEGHYVICDKCNIWYHPSCEGLDLNEIPESGISYFCKKCLNPKRKKKIISLVTTIQFLKSEAATTIQSKNDICHLHVSFQFQRKCPSKVSAMKVIDVLIFIFLIVQK